VEGAQHLPERRRSLQPRRIPIRLCRERRIGKDVILLSAHRAKRYGAPVPRIVAGDEMGDPAGRRVDPVQIREQRCGLEIERQSNEPVHGILPPIGLPSVPSIPE